MKKEKIVIIGAGSSGLSTALEISRCKSKEVILIEKNYAGSGQTGQCCGFVRNFYNAKEMIISANYSMKRIKNICKKHKIFDMKKLGLIVLDSEKNDRAIKLNVELLKSLEVSARFLNDKQIRKINPYINSQNSIAGYDEDAFYVNPQLMTDYLKNECLKNNVRLLERTSVTGILQLGRGFSVKTNRGVFKCDKLLNATAGYTNSINKMLGLVLPIKTIRINNAFYRLPLGPNKYLSAIADFENCFYIIPHKDFIDVSSMVLDLKKVINPAKHKDTFDENVIDGYLEIISKRIKGAERSAKLGGFGSHIDVSSDYYPILSEINEMPNYYCATGFSGTGFKHFPMIGKLMSELILEKEFTFPDLVEFFRYDRFNSSNYREDVKDSYFVKDD